MKKPFMAGRWWLYPIRIYQKESTAFVSGCNNRWYNEQIQHLWHILMYIIWHRHIFSVLRTIIYSFWKILQFDSIARIGFDYVHNVAWNHIIWRLHRNIIHISSIRGQFGVLNFHSLHKAALCSCISVFQAKLV